jgi:DNA adenine methylase
MGIINKRKIKTEVYNDINGDLVNLFQVVRDRLTAFEHRQYFLLSSRQQYETFRAAWQSGKPKDDIDRAIMYYYLLKNSFGANIVSGWGYGRSDNPRYPACLETLAEVRERLAGTYIENNGFEKCIEIWDQPEALFYLDPPYMNTEFYYKKGSGKFGINEHQRLRDALAGIKGRFILSYEDHPEVRRLYAGYRIEDIGEYKRSLNNKQGEEAKTAQEILIMNYEPTASVGQTPATNEGYELTLTP